MKKIFVAVLAMAGVVACNTVDTLDVPQNPEIRFANAFVENATRANEALDPSTTTESLTAFDVWGFMDNVTGTVFVGEDVTGSKGNFTYANTQYWVPGKVYYFYAVAPMDSANVEVVPATEDAAAKAGLGTLNFENIDGTEDLLYAAAPAVDAPDFGEAKTVELTFSHLLSKVKFTFTNGFTNDNAYIDVKNVRMTAPATATATLAAENSWAKQAGEITLAFGDACAKTAIGETQVAADERLTIPAGAEQKYTVTFDVALYMGDVVAYEAKDKTATIEGVALEIGKAYNFSATLNASNLTKEGEELQPIVFDVYEVEGWVPADDVATVLPANISGLTLVTNAVAKNTLQLQGDFDGAGHTLTVEAVDVIANTARLIDAKADSKVSNLTIDGNNYTNGKYGVRAFFLTGVGDFVIDNVDIKNVTYTLNDDGAAKNLTVVNSSLEGWTSFNKDTKAHFENVEFKVNTVNGLGTVRPYGTTTFKNCSFAEGFVIDLSCLAEGATVKFIDCTVAGQPMTIASEDVTITEAPANNGLVQNVDFVQGITIDGGGYNTTDNKGLRGLYITKGGVYNVNNVVVKNVTYALNVNTTEDVILNVVNSTLQGWSSYGDTTSATFKNVKFECGAYANFKPYTSTTLTNCSFEAGFMIDFTEISAGEVLTFLNCTYNGTVLTAENFASIVTETDGDYTGKIAFK